MLKNAKKCQKILKNAKMLKRKNAKMQKRKNTEMLRNAKKC